MGFFYAIYSKDSNFVIIIWHYSLLAKIIIKKYIYIYKYIAQHSSTNITCLRPIFTDLNCHQFVKYVKLYHFFASTMRTGENSPVNLSFQFLDIIMVINK